MNDSFFFCWKLLLKLLFLFLLLLLFGIKGNFLLNSSCSSFFRRSSFSFLFSSNRFIRSSKSFRFIFLFLFFLFVTKLGWNGHSWAICFFISSTSFSLFVFFCDNFVKNSEIFLVSFFSFFSLCFLFLSIFGWKVQFSLSSIFSSFFGLFFLDDKFFFNFLYFFLLGILFFDFSSDFSELSLNFNIKLFLSENIVISKRSSLYSILSSIFFGFLSEPSTSIISFLSIWKLSSGNSLLFFSDLFFEYILNILKVVNFFLSSFIAS